MQSDLAARVAGSTCQAERDRRTAEEGTAEQEAAKSAAAAAAAAAPGCVSDEDRPYNATEHGALRGRIEAAHNTPADTRNGGGALCTGGDSNRWAPDHMVARCAAGGALETSGSASAGSGVTSRRVLVCVSGSVAGIKVPELVRLLTGASAEVRLVATQHGATFLAKAPASSAAPDNDMVLHAVSDQTHWLDDCEGEPLSAMLADWADVLLFAPLSANTLAKLALGLCDNLATEVARGWPTQKPLLLAPAMNTKMWSHPATGRQLATLHNLGALVVEPVSKKLACGDIGVGAMASVQDICDAVLGSQVLHS